MDGVGRTRRYGGRHRRLTIEVRRATEIDLSALPAIERSAAAAFEGQDVPAWLLTDSSPADNWRPQLNAGTLWVAEVGGQPVGYLAASRFEDRLHIDEIDVMRDHQGVGLGRALLATAAEHAREMGLRRLSLTTFRHIAWNAPFYASFGFQEWDPQEAPASIRQMLLYEAARGLTNRCAMVMDL